MGVREEIEIGSKFGHLTILEEIEPIHVGSRDVRMVRAQCICGSIVEKQLKVLRQGTRCCGCTHKKPGYPPSVSVGDQTQTNEGYVAEIVEYTKHSKIKVKILDEFGAIISTTVQAFKEGSVSNPYHKSVYGVGCFGEPSDKWPICKPLYMTWAGMVERVHVVEALDKRPTYRVCSIIPQWYTFANFYEWAKFQIGSTNKGWQLDKDILVKGNKLYSPETCVFVPSRLNSLFTKREADRGKYPIGVGEYTTRQGKRHLKAIVCDPDKGGRIFGAGGGTVEECFAWYKEKKEEIIKRQAEKFKDQIDPRVYEALYKYEVEITD